MRSSRQDVILSRLGSTDSPRASPPHTPGQQSYRLRRHWQSHRPHRALPAAEADVRMAPEAGRLAGLVRQPSRR